MTEAGCRPKERLTGEVGANGEEVPNPGRDDNSEGTVLDGAAVKPPTGLMDGRTRLIELMDERICNLILGLLGEGIPWKDVLENESGSTLKESSFCVVVMIPTVGLMDTPIDENETEAWDVRVGGVLEELFGLERIVVLLTTVFSVKAESMINTLGEEVVALVDSEEGFEKMPTEALCTTTGTLLCEFTAVDVKVLGSRGVRNVEDGWFIIVAFLVGVSRCVVTVGEVSLEWNGNNRISAGLGIDGEWFSRSVVADSETPSDSNGNRGSSTGIDGSKDDDGLFGAKRLSEGLVVGEFLTGNFWLEGIDTLGLACNSKNSGPLADEGYASVTGRANPVAILEKGVLAVSGDGVRTVPEPVSPDLSSVARVVDSTIVFSMLRRAVFVEVGRSWARVEASALNDDGGSSKESSDGDTNDFEPWGKSIALDINACNDAELWYEAEISRTCDAPSITVFDAAADLSGETFLASFRSPSQTSGKKSRATGYASLTK
jgi:hypothetical protein